MEKSVLMIDYGSCENMMSKVMIDKLKLTCEDHPKPYKVSWFHKGGEIMVTQRCRMKFSIGKYDDEFYFNVLPMDACHLLLGSSINMFIMMEGRIHTLFLKRE